MSDFLDRLTQLSPKRLALLALDLNERLESAQRSAREPIAIVGLGCRIPGGATDADSLWALLHEGRDAIAEIPPDRWDVDEMYDPDPDAPGKIATRWGGFLEGIDRFDPAFFGISPREAAGMDPQQRLLLEVAWEALEHAGIAPDSLFGTRTGVFVGMCNGDYFAQAMTAGGDTLDMYVASGNSHAVGSGRLSYVLGLQGPSLTLDTACSSSLVALHLAVRALRAGECDAALAGGVNVICMPETSIALSRAHMMAPDGRCKAFDDSADGFVRSEGAGLVVLKRLSDATRDGDRVLAVIRGSAVNQDGRSSGLTAPNGPSQEAVIRAALADAGLAREDVDYVEAHGTGTALGDPIEMRALGAVYGDGRSAERPLVVGSIKTNVGHLESAAGIAGLLKVVVSLQRGAIPRSLHFRAPSRHIAWSTLPIAVAAEERPWPRGERPRVAAVSSFGFSGTNAHILLEEAPASVAALPSARRGAHLLVLSARTPEALEALARADDDELPALCATAAIGRSHFVHRLAVVGASAVELRERLASRHAEEPDERRVIAGRATPGESPAVAFLFTGQGAQSVGMGRALYEGAPTFREAMDR
jgi:acyl transferase domain-containing protein